LEIHNFPDLFPSTIFHLLFTAHYLPSIIYHLLFISSQKTFTKKFYLNTDQHHLPKAWQKSNQNLTKTPACSSCRQFYE